MTRNAEENTLSHFLPPEIHGWHAEGKDEFYNPETIFEYIDGAGEVYRSYNFQGLVARRYAKEGEPGLIADFFDMGTASDAFGVFTHDLEGEALEIGQGAVYKGGLLSLWKDRYFVSLYAEAETAEAQSALQDLGQAIASNIPGQGNKPAFLSFIPDGFDLKKVRYFHSYVILNYHFFISTENILLLDQKTEAVLAYSGEKPDKVFLLIVRYPDILAAVHALQNFAHSYMPDASETGLVQTENKKWTAVKINGVHLVLVFDALSPDQARDIIASVGEKIAE